MNESGSGTAFRGVNDASGMPKNRIATEIGVVLADDHPLILDGLAQLLQQYPRFKILERCSSGTAAIAAVLRHRPDVLVLDILMPDVDGFAVLRELRRASAMTQVVVLTARIDEDELIEALRLGVRGVVLKEMATRLLVDCLDRVHAGGQWLEKNSAARAMDKLLRREARAQEVARLLTPREIEVVRLVGQGLSNRELADKLFIAEGTVKIHLHNIYEKARVNRRTELVRFASEHGLV